MSDTCLNLHSFVNNLPRHHFPFNESDFSRNGIYILFEEGEEGHSCNRIVRIGTHTGDNQLRSRLKQHFIMEKKDRSIFRKNIGRCLLHQACDPYLDVWELDCTSSKGKAIHGHLLNHDYQVTIEKKVSEFIQSQFSFAVIEIQTKDERLYLESRLISTVSSCKECGPSTSWFGLNSPKEKIKQSGLWQVNELYKEALSFDDFNRLERLSS